MEQIWLAASLATGVVFGFLIAWLSLRSDRAHIYNRAKSDGDNERAALKERLESKEQRIREMDAQHEADREILERLRNDNAALKAAQLEAADKIADAQRVAEEKIQLIGNSHREVVESLRTSLGSRVQEQQARIQVLEAELSRARQDAGQAQPFPVDDIVRPLRESIERLGEGLHRPEAVQASQAQPFPVDDIVRPLHESIERLGERLHKSEAAQASQAQLASLRPHLEGLRGDLTRAVSTLYVLSDALEPSGPAPLGKATRRASQEVEAPVALVKSR